MERIVRIGVLAICAAAVAATVLVWRDLETFAGRPAPGFPLFSNAVVSFPIAATGDRDDVALRVRPFERVVAVDGTPVRSAAEVRAHVERAGAGAVMAYTLERLDGTRHEVSVPVVQPSRRDLYRVYLPFLVLGAAELLVGAVAVLARPGLVTTRLVFAMTAGLGIPMGMLTPDHFEGHRLSPWTRVLAFVPVPVLLHLALVFPRRLAPLVRAPRAVLTTLYGVGGALLLLHLVGFYRDARLLAATAGAMLLLNVVGFALFTWNLASAARRAPTAIERQRARVVLPGPIAMTLGVAAFGAANALGIDVHPALQLAPVLVIVVFLAYAMLGHNLFEFDAAVRRALAIGALALLGAAAYVGAFSALRGGLGAGVAWASTVATTLVVLLAVPTIGAAGERAERLVEGLLFPAQRASRELLHEAAAQLGRLRSPEELREFLREALVRGLGCTSLRILAGAPDRPLAEVAPGEAEALALAPADPLYVAIRRGVAVAANAADAADRRAPSRAAVRRVSQLGVALAVPLPPTPHAIGALLLGPRGDGRLYTRDDETLVATLAGQAAAALDNAGALAALRSLERRLVAENLQLREAARLDPALDGLVGRSPALHAVVEQVRAVAPTDASVLVEGETGTGKELVVRAIHALSRRSDRLLVQVACAALPEPLLESELFGHAKGAFTGADERRAGRLEIADGGTLFLDDVDTLPLGIQAKLLRVLQEGELQKLGEARVTHVDLRVVAATNRDLRAEVRAGRFREDLYYRLDVVPIRIPPLRERREDIAPLVEHFVRTRSAKLGRPVRSIAAEAMAELEAYAWPGNVRELRNVIERALVMQTGDVLRLPAPLAAGDRFDARGEALAEEVGSAPLPELLRRYRRGLLDAALERAGGSQQDAARLLGLHRQSFARMLREDAADEAEA